MPLIKGSSKGAVSENIRREKAAGKPQRQAVAIALETARRSRATGGRLNFADGGTAPTNQADWLSWSSNLNDQLAQSVRDAQARAAAIRPNLVGIPMPYNTIVPGNRPNPFIGQQPPTGGMGGPPGMGGMGGGPPPAGGMGGPPAGGMGGPPPGGPLQASTTGDWGGPGQFASPLAAAIAAAGLPPGAINGAGSTAPSTGIGAQTGMPYIPSAGDPFTGYTPVPGELGQAGTTPLIAAQQGGAQPATGLAGGLPAASALAPQAPQQAAFDGPNFAALAQSQQGPAAPAAGGPTPGGALGAPTIDDMMAALAGGGGGGAPAASGGRFDSGGTVSPVAGQTQQQNQPQQSQWQQNLAPSTTGDWGGPGQYSSPTAAAMGSQGLNPNSSYSVTQPTTGLAGTPYANLGMANYQNPYPSTPSSSNIYSGYQAPQQSQPQQQPGYDGPGSQSSGSTDPGNFAPGSTNTQFYNQTASPNNMGVGGDRSPTGGGGTGAEEAGNAALMNAPWYEGGANFKAPTDQAGWDDLYGKMKASISPAEIKQGTLHVPTEEEYIQAGSASSRPGYVAPTPTPTPPPTANGQTFAQKYGGRLPFAAGGKTSGWAKWRLTHPNMAKAGGGAQHFSGAIKSPVPGRTDKIPLTVKAGSYVLPAEHVSHLGQGNTTSGHAIIDKMFTVPKSAPYGVSAPHGGGGTLKPHPFKAQHLADGGVPYDRDTGVAAPQQFDKNDPKYDPRNPGYSNKAFRDAQLWYPGPKFPTLNADKFNQAVEGMPESANVEDRRNEPPMTDEQAQALRNKANGINIMAAGGEHVLTPEQIIARLGDLDKGHDMLDQWVQREKKNQIKVLRKLPAPRKD